MILVPGGKKAVPLVQPVGITGRHASEEAQQYPYAPDVVRYPPGTQPRQLSVNGSVSSADSHPTWFGNRRQLVGCFYLQGFIAV